MGYGKGACEKYTKIQPDPLPPLNQKLRRLHQACFYPILYMYLPDSLYDPRKLLGKVSFRSLRYVVPRRRGPGGSYHLGATFFL